jgi:hypothetical protein
VNARGGPGIVLATTAIAAGIIDARTFTALVVLALATSAGAGAWLGWTLRRNPAADALIRDVAAGVPASAEVRPSPAVPLA